MQIEKRRRAAALQNAAKYRGPWARRPCHEVLGCPRGWRDGPGGLWHGRLARAVYVVLRSIGFASDRIDSPRMSRIPRTIQGNHSPVFIRVTREIRGRLSSLWSLVALRGQSELKSKMLIKHEDTKARSGLWYSKTYLRSSSVSVIEDALPANKTRANRRLFVPSCLRV